MTRRKRVVFSVSFIMPEKAHLEDCREYVKQAIMEWRGQCHQGGDDDGGKDDGDPMYYLDPNTVSIRNTPKRRKP